MASVLGPPPFFRLFNRPHIPHIKLSCIAHVNLNSTPSSSIRAAWTQGRGIGDGLGDYSIMLRRPVILPVVTSKKTEEGVVNGKREEAELADWEVLILQETAPLAGLARMILHSGKYEIGDRLSSYHEKTIVEKLLLYHPEHEQKIGCGLEYIKVGLHPQFQQSRCLFITRSDGQTVDFSYWKCIKGLIRKKYPLYADSFIIKHLKKQSQ